MKRTISIILIFAMLFAASACGGTKQAEQPSFSSSAADESSADEPEQPSEQEAPPEPEEEPFAWQYDVPENQGADGSKLAALHSTYASFPLYSAVVVKNGVVIDAYYADGFNEASTFPVHSVSKSITSALIGIAIDEGYISGVDEPLSDYFPEILDFEDSRWADITLWHLLTHTSGMVSTDHYDWNGWRNSENWIEYIFSYPLNSTPGTVFDYSTGNTHLLSAVLEKATGEKFADYAAEKLLKPLGMESASVGTDPQGIGDGGNGFVMTTLDMARFGLLFANGGVWQEKQVVPAEWVEESTGVCFEREGHTCDYGYQWWVRTFNKHPAYFAQGYAGQFIFVVPELSLVIAITSEYTGSSNVYWQIARDIVLACEK